MRKSLRTSIAMTIVLGAGLGAASVAVRAHDPRQHKAANRETASTRMQAAMKEGEKAQRGMKLKGEADHDFVEMMTLHHKTAIAMAEIEVREGSDQQVRDMAQKIIDGQRAEIARFDAWMSNQHGGRPVAH